MSHSFRNSGPIVLAVAGALAGGFGIAAAADMPLKAPLAPVTAAPAAWVNLFGGAAVVPDAYYFDAGAVVALNRNLAQPGFLVRINGGAGHYVYNRTATLEQGVDFQAGELMIGYQTFFGATRLSAYIGPNVEHHDNPDPLADVAGTRWGVKAQGEIFAPLSDNLYLFGLGNVSSAWSSYFLMGKLGYKVLPSIAVGPEAAALGNDRYDAVRAGGFLAFDVGAMSQIIVSGGYSWDTNSDALNDHSGAYATLHIRTSF